jgi:hypothetical protein
MPKAKLCAKQSHVKMQAQKQNGGGYAFSSRR